MSSDDDWGLLPKGQSDLLNEKKIHRIASTSTIKSIEIESSTHSLGVPSNKLPDLCLITQARLQLLSKPVNFNIMVLGDSNTGKSSFIHSVLAKYFNKIVPELVGKKSLHPTRNVVNNIGIMSNSDIELRVNLLDTPGYGFFTTREKWLETITSFIIQQAYNYKQGKKLNTKAMTEDCRVHIALYFIEGPRCKEVDLDMMHKLQRFISILPVLAKADMFSKKELEQVKLSIIAQCAEAGIHFFDTAEALKGNISELNDTLLPPIPPFAVISGGHLIQNDEEVVFIRKYA